MKEASLLLMMMGICMCAQAVEFDQEKLSQIPKKMQEMIDANEIAGAVTCLVTRDKIVHLETTGQADVEKGIPMKADSMFWIASMTKPLTGASIMMLQEQGKLSIDDPVAMYIPEFADIKGPSGKPANLTIKHLLSHTSGLVEPSKPAHKCKNLAELIPLFSDKPTLFEPGTQWKYSQSGINALGRIIEVVSGESYADFIQRKFLDPLGMKDTTFYPTPEQMKRIATSYRRTDDGKLEPSAIRMLDGIDFTNRDRVALPNAGLFSTAPDYARFAQMLLNEGSLDGKTYLKSDSVKRMTSNLTGNLKAGFIPAKHHWGYAIGVVEEQKDMTAMLSPGTFGHGGAYGTQAWIDPMKGVAYILMVQRANFKNSDDSPVRMVFQQAAADASKQ